MTPSEGKDADSRDKKNIYYSYILTAVVSFGFFIFFSSVVVVDLISTMKCN